jgi:putative transposase
VKKLKAAQQALSRKKKGSANRAKARRRVATLHGRIADARQDFQHQLSTRLIRENQGIGLESLAVWKMVQHRHLARSISDASWSAFTRKLVYKAEWYGRDMVFVDRWLPSPRMCSGCGVVRTPMALSIRSWTCGSCGASHDRDVHAALHIKSAAGLADLSLIMLVERWHLSRLAEARIPFLQVGECQGLYIYTAPLPNSDRSD